MNYRVIERGRLRQAVADFPKNLNGFTITTGIFPPIALTLAISAPVVSLLSDEGWSQSAIVAFLTASFGAGGLIGLMIAMYYKIPISGAWSLPAIVVAFSAGNGVSISEIYGGFFIAAAIVLVLGITGIFRRLVNALPFPILLAMVAGVLLQFPVQMASGFTESATTAIIIGSGVIGYVLFDRLGGPFRLLPGVFGVFAVGGAVAGAMGELDFSGFEFALGEVEFYSPSFSFTSALSIAIPMVLIILGADNMQATGILKSAGHEPPINGMTTATGLGSVLAILLGGSHANMAGPTTALVVSGEAGPEEGRYVAGAIAGVSYIVHAFVMGTLVALIGALPQSLLVALLGMVLLRPVVEAIQQAWRADRFAIGAFFTFFIAVSDISVLGISAPFWAIIGGVVASLLFEFEDFRKIGRTAKSTDVSEASVPTSG